jgi:imidazoleglycerol-phosphate dehydratase
MEMTPIRTATVERNTAETQIYLTLTLDGDGSSKIATKVPFFDHMLTLFAKHGLVNLELQCNGDIEVDFHHTVEDVGISLGQAFNRALGDKKGLRRYGHAYVPMDETLARVAIDFSGRPFLLYRAPERVDAIGHFPFQLVEEFMRGFAVHAGITLHAEILYGRDAHHMAEALFKALAKAIDHATQIDPRVVGVPSTKGML